VRRYMRGSGHIDGRVTRRGEPARGQTLVRVGLAAGAAPTNRAADWARVERSRREERTPPGPGTRARRRRRSLRRRPADAERPKRHRTTSASTSAAGTCARLWPDRGIRTPWECHLAVTHPSLQVGEQNRRSTGTGRAITRERWEHARPPGSRRRDSAKDARPPSRLRGVGRRRNGARPSTRLGAEGFHWASCARSA